MPAATLSLWPATPPDWDPADDRPRPRLEWHPHTDGGQRPCLLIFHGGGYHECSAFEAGPIAAAANAAGFHAACCFYRLVNPASKRPLGRGPLYDAQRAIRLLRSRAGEWGIGPLATIGFSAGGHLCACTGVHWRLPAPPEDDLAAIPVRPEAFAPCYAVICGTHPLKGTCAQSGLCGPQPDPETVAFFSIEQQVTADTPPCFLWSTAEDRTVPVANSLRLAEACARAGVPVELHVFPHGGHGLALAANDPVVSQWWGLCTAWLQRVLND
jgi:acetyl esterase/lipase